MYPTKGAALLVTDRNGRFYPAVRRCVELLRPRSQHRIALADFDKKTACEHLQRLAADSRRLRLHYVLLYVDAKVTPRGIETCDGDHVGVEFAQAIHDMNPSTYTVVCAEQDFPPALNLALAHGGQTRFAKIRDDTFCPTG